jgi:tRNA (guanine37-N1)-methyltransferase
MQFEVFTLLPEVMQAYLQASVLGKAIEAGLFEVRLHNIREYTTDRHRTTDDEPYGGGGGMVMKPEPIFAAVETVLGDSLVSTPVVLLTPQGRKFDQAAARSLSKHPRIALLCGRYEGVDERARQHLATDEISVGDFVLTGGELPALIVIDSIARLLPGVLGDAEAPHKDSYANGLLEHPHYTRPASFRGWNVPEVLLSGDHARVAAWRRQKSLERTWRRRPDLLSDANIDEDDRSFLAKLIEDDERNIES